MYQLGWVCLFFVLVLVLFGFLVFYFLVVVFYEDLEFFWVVFWWVGYVYQGQVQFVVYQGIVEMFVQWMVDGEFGVFEVYEMVGLCVLENLLGGMWIWVCIICVDDVVEGECVFYVEGLYVVCWVEVFEGNYCYFIFLGSWGSIVGCFLVRVGIVRVSLLQRS